MSSSGKPSKGKCSAGDDQDSSERRIPAGGDLDRARRGALERQHAGKKAGDKDPEEPAEDEVVRRVGERSLVPAGVDVDGDVPEEPDQGDDQGRSSGSTAGNDDQPGRPLYRSADPGPSAEQPNASAAMPQPEHQQRD